MRAGPDANERDRFVRRHTLWRAVQPGLRRLRWEPRQRLRSRDPSDGVELRKLRQRVRHRRDVHRRRVSLRRGSGVRERPDMLVRALLPGRAKQLRRRLPNVLPELQRPHLWKRRLWRQLRHLRRVLVLQRLVRKVPGGWGLERTGLRRGRSGALLRGRRLHLALPAVGDRVRGRPLQREPLRCVLQRQSPREQRIRVQLAAQRSRADGGPVDPLIGSVDGDAHSLQRVDESKGWYRGDRRRQVRCGGRSSS